MLSPTALRRWSWTHKWSSLVCTAFMLLLCITGLPLIFHHEIGHLLGTEVEAPAMPANTPRAKASATTGPNAEALRRRLQENEDFLAKLLFRLRDFPDAADAISEILKPSGSPNDDPPDCAYD